MPRNPAAPEPERFAAGSRRRRIERLAAIPLILAAKAAIAASLAALFAACLHAPPPRTPAWEHFLEGELDSGSSSVRTERERRCVDGSNAQEPPPTVKPKDGQEPAPGSAPSKAEEKPKPPPSLYVEPRSYSTKRETEPPRYVRTLGKTDLVDDPDLSWLDVGLDYRFRYEYRDDDLRRATQTLDDLYLYRTRAYVGVKELLDPFRFGVEFQDSRRSGTQFPADNRDTNRYDLIQAYGELYFADALGDRRPFRIQAGRLAFEYLDRRLIARNEWRNTTNNFDGVRAILGQQENDWQVDLLALKPVERLLDRFDRPMEELTLYGAIGDWRRWSEVVTLQPYYLLLHQSGDGTVTEREIHTLGLRAYGIFEESGFDYDVQGIVQFGRSNGLTHQAHAYTAELGYTAPLDWKPRAAAFFGYATGDRNPNDSTNERFERLFGFSRPWSANDYVTFDNVLAPKVRLEASPHERIRLDLGYGAFWLASETDSWSAVGLRDSTGNSGGFMGQEIDVRVRLKVWDRIEVDVGYAYFAPGNFPTNLGKGQDSDFFYIQISPRLFK